MSETQPPTNDFAAIVTTLAAEGLCKIPAVEFADKMMDLAEVDQELADLPARIGEAVEAMTTDVPLQRVMDVERGAVLAILTLCRSPNWRPPSQGNLHTH